jgi:hypothetical protein
MQYYPLASDSDEDSAQPGSPAGGEVGEASPSPLPIPRKRSRTRLAQLKLTPSQSSCMAMAALLLGHLVDLTRPTETGQGRCGQAKT